MAQLLIEKGQDDSSSNVVASNKQLIHDIKKLEFAFKAANEAGDKKNAQRFAEELNRLDNLATTYENPQGDWTSPGRELDSVYQGLNKPIDAIEHFLPKAAEKIADVGQYVTSFGKTTPNVISQSLGDASDWLEKKAQTVSDINEADYAKFTQDRIKAGRGEDTDWYELGAQVFHPINLAGAAALPLRATSLLGTIGQGAKYGAIGAVQDPIYDNDDYWQKFGSKAIVGGTVGGAATPIIGAASKAIANQFQKFGKTNFNEELVDDALKNYAKDTNQKITDLDAKQINEIKESVRNALKKHKSISVEQAATMKDFEKLGIEPTKGQLTREPMQWSREQDLLGVRNVGEPLTARLTEQSQAVRKNIGKLSSPVIDEIDDASIKFSKLLKKKDDKIKKKVSVFYKEARESAGKDFEVPLEGLAQDFADIYERFPDKIPQGVFNRFKSYGLIDGTQTKIFTVEEADHLKKLISQNWTPESDFALSQLNKAVEKAVINSVPSGGVFRKPVKAAADRFALHRKIPALQSASNLRIGKDGTFENVKGAMTPDLFVKRFVLDEKNSKNLQTLAKMLKKEHPGMFKQIRDQVGENIRLAAFGSGELKDTAIRPEMLAKAIKKYGTRKLRAFYTEEEVNTLKAAARVAKNIKTPPEFAKHSKSDTPTGLINTLLSTFTRSPIGGEGARSAEREILKTKGKKFVKQALTKEPLAKAAKLTPRQQKLLAGILGTTGIGSGTISTKKVEDENVK